MPVGAVPFPFGACRICNDKATGVHYGVATCEGCKGFFKRSILRGDRYKCFFGDQCSISPQTRNRCKACRYRRCQEQGMALDAVKMGRIPKVEKEKALMMARMGPTNHCASNVETSLQAASNMDVSSDSSGEGVSQDPKPFDSPPSSLEAQPGASSSQVPYPVQQSMEVANGHNLQMDCGAGKFSRTPYSLDAPVPSSSGDMQSGRNESFPGGSSQSHPKWVPEQLEQPVFRDMDSHQLQTVPRSFTSSVDSARGPSGAHSGIFSKSSSQHSQPMSWQESWPDHCREQPGTSYSTHRESSYQAGDSYPDSKPFHSSDKGMHFRQRHYSGEDKAIVPGSADISYRQSVVPCATSQASCLYSQAGPSTSHQSSRGQPQVQSSDNGSSSLHGSVYSSSVLKVLYDQVVKQSSEDQLLEKLADKCSSSGPSMLTSSIELLHSLAPASGKSSASSLSELSVATMQCSPALSISTSSQYSTPSVTHTTPTHSQVALTSTHSFPQQSSSWACRDGMGSGADHQQGRHSSDGDEGVGNRQSAIKDFSRRLAVIVNQETYCPTSALDIKLFDACFSTNHSTKNCIEEHAEFLKQKPKQPVLDEGTLEEFLKTERTSDDNPGLMDLSLGASSSEEEKSDLPSHWRASESSATKPQESNVTFVSSGQNRTDPDAKMQNGFVSEIKTGPGLDQNRPSCHRKWSAGNSTSCNGSKAEGLRDEEDTQGPVEIVSPTSPAARVVLKNSLQKRFALMLQWKQDLEEFLAENPTDPYVKEVAGVLTSEDMKELWGYLTISLNDWNSRIIGFCKEVPGFLSLDATDQSQLLKRAYYDIWMIMSSPFFRHNKSYHRFPNGKIYKKWVMERIISKPMVDHLFKFSEQFVALQLNDTAVATICAIQLTAAHHDSADFVNLEAIQQLNSTYLDHLVEEVSSSHPNTSSRILVDIFRLIPLLIDINKLLSQVAAHYILTDPSETEPQGES